MTPPAIQEEDHPIMSLNPPALRGAPGPRHGRAQRAIALIVGSVLTLLAVGSETANAADGPPSKRVSYADLNLRAPEGRAVLVRRVKVAARQVCNVSASPLPLGLRRSNACIRATVDHAMAQVERAIVLAELSR